MCPQDSGSGTNWFAQAQAKSKANAAKAKSKAKAKADAAGDAPESKGSEVSSTRRNATTRSELVAS